RIVGPRGAVVPGQGDDPRPAGFDLLQHVLGVTLADRLPGRMRVAQYRLRYQRGPGRMDGQVQPAGHGPDRDVEGLFGNPRICSIRGWPQPLIRTRPKPRTLTTSACSVT